jgi:hypothetical protein
MKKLLVIIAVMLLSGCFAPVRSQFQSVKINKTSDTIIKKDSIKASDSIVHVQKDSIRRLHHEAKLQTIRHNKELKAAQDKYLWGNMPPIMYLYGLIFALIGILINTVIITKKAIKTDATTPLKFNFMYWWDNNKDRLMRWIGILAVIFIGMRFSTEILNTEFTMFLSFLLGLLLDKFIEILKNLKLPKQIDSSND